ncbi:hypothetical protein ACWOCB_07470 [Gemella haemolysans]|uniref:PepSY domain-containing protein n=1 Tax=Gemella haemolysans ATCC 10379 TaxID=546270 RepID=C5NVC6_9BACL|nr:hypothetical protein [Gemella haemolysans]EER68942.1 hypothetical protein GEMHA0001_1505 [Gemella haemolysans ATCC 10379]KAA8706977.1 hypothetical protein F4V11_06730 [Gemella haemolysans]UBH81841.1 hypothetical protein LA340_05795 [Gemella haemolysans]VEI38246.1 Uncharacterised protein [Gemella haemolysans]
MRLKRILLPLVAAYAGYRVYQKTEEQELNNDHIDRCRNKLIALGYDVIDSYTLNLKENSYLMFYFVNDNIEYEVRYDKESETIEYIKEV